MTVIGGTRNPYRKQVGADIRDALLIASASSEGPAQYQCQEDQEVMLEAVFQKYSQISDVWSAVIEDVSIFTKPEYESSR